MNMRANELINSDIYVREPVDKYKNKINNSESNKVILTGGRGTGKSVVLNELQQRGLGTNNQTVLMRFDSVINFDINPTEYFSREFFINYYELEMANFLLSYIRKYYGLHYERYFCKYWYEVKERLDKVVHYANNIAFVEDDYLNDLMNAHEITSKIIDDMKNIIGIDKLNVAFDRFDWTNGKSAFSQVLLKEYFDSFDKAIITTDDENLNDEKYINNGYNIIKLDYGKDIDVVKKIINNRIDQYLQKNHDINIDSEKLNDEVFKFLLDNTDGNISTMINVINNFLSTYVWRGGIDDYMETIKYETNKENDVVKQLKRMGPQPKLWI